MQRRLHLFGMIADLLEEIRACRACEAHLPHGVRPIIQAGRDARVLIVGQAPGSRVHASGISWDDDSGDRLRDWTGLSRRDFYDPEQVALMPMGLCYPGKGTGGDLPPRRECAPLWHDRLLAAMPTVRLTLLVGQYAQKAWLPPALRPSMTATVRRWREMPEGLFPLPHPAWRSRLWMAKHPWFEAGVLPVLRERVSAALRRD
ncbi:uracil-DNA glycosylase [Novosphingobium marinum]|uniref:Uracil-DNA glycosylase n=1 Tax=Novosphingobium marinum TaxID=1514948 RepID=A0A7Z0BW46_9SPHN|nr:uracil-DNA glycosylase family protein [Novosphingobium marinum]NYH96035.1 uracil-DNA glycosylase [Novosphingobium marinum]GGC31904.1 uracil-DNA glycosylase [Novosphingobium marinum]